MSNIGKVGIWLILSLLSAAAQAGTKYYYYTDPQGTVLAEADAQGNIIARYDYAPYGKQVLGTPPSGPAGYTGHVNDAESGLVYMQQRYYDPMVGRFLSVDPVTAYSNPAGAFNRYWYANNNPYRFTDPDGRQSKENCDEACQIREQYEKDFGRKSEQAKTARSVAEGASTAGDVAETIYVAALPVPVKIGLLGRVSKFFNNLVKPAGKIAPKVGSKILKQMGPRGWTQEAIDEAVTSGKQFKAINKATGNPATRYVNPNTGQSVVVDNVTGDVIHVGGPGFKYGSGSGDLP